MLLSFCFLSFSVSVPALAFTESSSGALVTTDFIPSNLTPYLKCGVQLVSGDNSVFSFARYYGNNYQPDNPGVGNNVDNSILTSTLLPGSSLNGLLLDYGESSPFPSQSSSPLYFYPRFSSTDTYEQTPITPYSFAFVVPPPASSSYHGLSLAFSEIIPSLTVSTYIASGGSNIGPSSTIKDCYVSIVINGKVWSTKHFNSSSSPLDTIVTLDVDDTDTVAIMFSIYPPTVFYITPGNNLLCTYSFNMIGRYRTFTFPGGIPTPTAYRNNYPLQACWYSTASPPPSYSDGFEGGVPGDYDPSNPGDGSGDGSDVSEQLKEIQDSLEDLGTTLDEYQEQVTQLAEDINTGLDKVDQTIKDSTDTIMGDDSDPDNPTGIKGIIASIKSLPQLILDGIVHLFVPTEEQFQQLKSDYDTLLEDKFGLGYQAIELVDTLFTSIHDSFTSSEPYQFTFPSISLPFNGSTLVILEETPVSLDNAVMDVLRPVAGTAVIILCVLAFINTAKKFLEFVVSGKSLADFESSE